jgi:hypothetical protein
VKKEYPNLTAPKYTKKLPVGKPSIESMKAHAAAVAELMKKSVTGY